MRLDDVVDRLEEEPLGAEAVGVVLRLGRQARLVVEDDAQQPVDRLGHVVELLRAVDVLGDGDAHEALEQLVAHQGLVLVHVRVGALRDGGSQRGNVLREGEEGAEGPLET